MALFFSSKNRNDSAIFEEQDIGLEESQSEIQLCLRTGKWESYQRLDNKSRMSREAPVRFCEGVRVRFPCATRRVICCQFEEDAQRIKKAFPKRLEKFKLQLNEEKTKLVSFDKKLAERGVEQGTFDFLGFTFYIGKSLKGWMIPKVRTRAKTIRAKLKKVTTWIKLVRNRHPVKTVWKIFIAKVRGHIQYYGVSHNSRWVEKFIHQAAKIMFKWLNRRSQRKSFTWEEFDLFIQANPVPPVRVAHCLF